MISAVVSVVARRVISGREVGSQLAPACHHDAATALGRLLGRAHTMGRGTTLLHRAGDAG